MASLLDIVKTSGKWDLVGVCAPEISKDYQLKFENWLESNQARDLGYVERRKQERLDPRRYFPEAKSIIVLASYYFSGWAKTSPKISNYTWDEDYHVRLREMAETSLASLKDHHPNIKARICVDTSPLLEKVLAVQAGLGWQAKNSLLINRKFGSQIFLAEILTDIELEEFELKAIESDHCGNCRRCLDACPTQALKPYQLDAQKCISYWNLEHKGPFDEHTPAFEGWLAGCDICQEVCPWNSKLIPLQNRPNDFEALEASQVLKEDEWAEKIQTKAISYVNKSSWPRNLAHLVDSLTQDS